MAGDIGPQTRQYWNHRQLAEGLHVSRAHLYRLLADGQMLGPDVLIAPVTVGWEPQRAKRFGADTNRLDADGRPLGPQADGSLAKVKDLIKTRYGSTPTVYVSSWLASYVYGLDKAAVFFARQRHSFIPADVRVGRKLGWGEERVIEFGLQTGRMDDPRTDAWAVRRTEEFGLSPKIAWVERRVKERPGLAQELECAKQAWRVRQKAATEGR